MIDWLAISCGAGWLFLLWLACRSRRPKPRPFSRREIELLSEREEEQKRR